jgi:hypothetical protein
MLIEFSIHPPLTCKRPFSDSHTSTRSLQEKVEAIAEARGFNETRAIREFPLAVEQNGDYTASLSTRARKVILFMVQDKGTSSVGLGRDSVIILD